MSFPPQKSTDFIIQEEKDENEDSEIQADEELKESNLGPTFKSDTISYLNKNQQILKDIRTEKGSIDVCVTGASGFLGSQIVKELLAAEYNVTAGISHATSEEGLQLMQRLQTENKEKMRFIRFDMTKMEECDLLVKDSDVIIHCATKGRNEKQEHQINILYPEIEGVLNLLTCAEKHKIPRFLLIGSVSSIAAGKFRKVFNETHWAHPDDCDDYERAKLFVERTTWNFVEERAPSIHLTVFCPGLLLGPLLRKGEGSASVLFLKKLVNDNFNQIFDLKIPTVDVRDVAYSVVSSIEKAESFGQRYILVEGVYKLDQMYRIIQHDSNLKQINSGGFFSKIYVRFLAVFDRDLRKIIDFYGKNYKFENEKSKRELKTEYRPLDQSLGAMVVSLEKYKVVNYLNDRVRLVEKEPVNDLFMD